MNREDARECFENNLSYEKITPHHIRILANMIEEELIDYFKNGGFQAQQMNMSIAQIRKKDIIFDGKLKSASIKIDGSYFKRREGVTFNNSGFIGFGGEFSDVNVEPILKAFCKWCMEISKTL